MFKQYPNLLKLKFTIPKKGIFLSLFSKAKTKSSFDGIYSFLEKIEQNLTIDILLFYLFIENIFLKNFSISLYLK